MANDENNNIDINKADDANKKNAMFSWLARNKTKIIRTLLIVVGLAIFVLICYKYYSINQTIKKQNEHIRSYALQLEQIIEGSDKLVFVTWKDQKEGIQFIDNPSYKKKSQGELSKAQQIQAEIEKVGEEINKKAKEVDTLKDKELYYITEINKLEVELENAKTRVLDEGAALGFAETVLREFK